MRAAYQTQQRKILIDYLQHHKDRHFTVEELMIEMQEAVPLSSLYRLMKKLSEEGIVRKSVRPGERQYEYQIAENKTCHSHLHLQCTGCGKVMHVSDETSQKAQQLMQGVDGFELDYEKTLLYGTCTECKLLKTEKK
ncbi:MAG: transcriptional repressor [Lachnospiraceae bacterium]|nr:transcriptional repressor [Lachnospiraceae bacterium]